MAGFYDLIPGLKEAEQQFRDEQLEAFLDVEPSICGKIELAPFTAKMFIELDAVGSQLLSDNSAPEPEHVAMFLWRCSPEFDRHNAWKRFWFTRRVGKLPYGQTVVEIRDYLRRSFAPLPAVKRKVTDKNTVTYSAWPSHIVHMFASVYGWSETYTLNVPLRRLYQYLNRILEEQDPDFKQLCPAAAELKRQFLLRAKVKSTGQEGK